MSDWVDSELDYHTDLFFYSVLSVFQCVLRSLEGLDVHFSDSRLERYCSSRLVHKNSSSERLIVKIRSGYSSTCHRLRQTLGRSARADRGANTDVSFACNTCHGNRTAVEEAISYARPLSQRIQILGIASSLRSWRLSCIFYDARPCTCTGLLSR